MLNNATALASGITYKPFGGMNAITFGNNLSGSFGYDSQYRISTIQAGALQSLSYGYDYNGNVTGIVNNLDNTKNKSYTYDNLNRLAAATGPWGALSWTLDPVGNRLTQVDASGTSTYTYATGSNKLSAITGANPASYTSDANGNTLSENAKIFTYNQNQRLIQAASTQTGNYVYDASGQRVKKTVGGEVTIYHYDQNGQLIAESSNSGAVQVEYVYLEGIPLAKIDGSGTQYIHTDHQGTPVMMTDCARAKVWEIENRPFGDGVTVSGTVTLNLRFPGQYYDAESGLNYNYFRDYNPGVGRYIQAGPIGLGGGVNPLIYGLNNPTFWIDPGGLSGRPINSKLSGKLHPTTKVPFDADGYPDFSKFASRQVEIAQTGNRWADEKAANIKARLSKTPDGYTWHHHQNGTTMQLVPTTIHSKTGHSGGVARILKAAKSCKIRSVGVMGVALGGASGALEDYDRYQRAKKAGISYSEQLDLDLKDAGPLIWTPAGVMPNTHYDGPLPKVAPQLYYSHPRRI